MLQSGDYEDRRTEGVLRSKELNRFINDFHRQLDRYMEKYGVENDNDLSLYGVGGAQTMMYHLPDMDERRSNDLDFMISHTGHSQGDMAFLEARALQGALEELGFEFTTGPDDRSYDPREEGCQTLSNVEGAKNGLPVTNLDLMAGEEPLGKYPIEWVEQYSEPISENLGVLGLEATAVRKIFRNTVDYQGREDDDQTYDIGAIAGFISGETDRFDMRVFEDSWEDLLEANTDKRKPVSEAKAVLKRN